MSNELDYIKNNIESIMKRVSDAAEKSSRKKEDIKIIAVSKTVDVDRIRRAIDFGILDLGENRVQELCDKYDSFIGSLCNWHLIGHLQTNKVKYILDKVTMIHSLDSLELANEIQNRSQKAGRITDVLVQVNIAEEDSKFGLKKEMLSDFLKKVCEMSNIKVRGLMTIAPLAENPEEIRWVFKELKKLHIDISMENIDNINMDYLSMGMSNDFEAAIEEGSNIVRIGTAIFGKR